MLNQNKINYQRSAVYVLNVELRPPPQKKKKKNRLRVLHLSAKNVCRRIVVDYMDIMSGLSAEDPIRHQKGLSMTLKEQSGIIN